MTNPVDAAISLLGLMYEKQAEGQEPNLKITVRKKWLLIGEPVFKLQVPGISPLRVTLTYAETSELVLFLQERIDLMGIKPAPAADEVTMLSKIIVQICDVVRQATS
jgi:hypothetical protein